MEDRFHRLEEETRLLRGVGEEGDSQDSGLSLAQESLVRSDGVRPGDSRKRPAAEDGNWWIEDQRNSLPLPEEVGAFRLSSYGMRSDYPISPTLRLSKIFYSLWPCTLLTICFLVLRTARQRISLEKIITDFKDLEHLEEATKQSVQLLALLESALSDCCIPLRFLRADNEDPRTCVILQQLMHQIHLGFRSCFESLDHICRTIPGRTKKQDLVYRMAIFFNKALNLLETISILQTEQEEDQDRRRLRNKRAKTEEGEYAVNRYLAGALSAIIFNLDLKVGKPGHGEVLEGILFSILEHTGRLLSEAVFCEHVAESTSPGNITQGQTSSHNHSKIESRYIVQILQAAIGSAERKELVAKVLAWERKDLDSLKRIGTLASSSSFTKDLVSRSKMLLQSTLLKSAVGGDNLASLKLPDPPAEESNFSVEAPGEVERYGPDWLVGMVWALIGWDMVVGDD